MISDLGVIFKVYLISLGLQLLVWPWVSRWFKELADGGWALGRVFSLLAIGLPIWFLSHIWPVNTDWGVAVMILVLMLVGLRAIQGCDPKIRVAPLRMILMEEGMFLVGFFGLALVRGFQPDILGLEKFMDFGFIKEYLISSKLPVNDMWLAGKTINYYSFGHFMASILVRIWGVGLGVGYNLLLAWILGASLALSFAIVVNLGGGILGGVVGSLLVCLGGNSHTWWYLIRNKGFTSYWYASATRFIENTIHEFPGYSFVVSDLHAHVLGLPIVLAFLLVLVAILQGYDPPLARQPKGPAPPISGVAPFRVGPLNTTVLGVLLGVMVMTNTWDLAIFGLLLVVFGLLLLVNKRISVKQLLISSGVIGATAGIVAMAWLVNFQSFSDGVGLVDGRSPWWQMGVLWGGHLVVTLMALWLAFRRKTKKNILVIAIGITAVLLLIIPEVIYVKDIYTSHQRANTMFKLTYQAFIMMSLLFGWVVGQVLTRCRPLKVRKALSLRRRVLMVMKCLWLSLMLVLWGGFMIFPLEAFNSYYGGLKMYKGLDGLVWLQKDQDKWGMIEYLEEHSNGLNMVEAVGDSYSNLNSVSAFSGTPTVAGWRVHEWLWRGGYGVVGEREALVKEFYERGEKKLLDTFNVGWIVVGPNERQKYQIDENRLLDLGGVVWSGGKSYLIQVID